MRRFVAVAWPRAVAALIVSLALASASNSITVPTAQRKAASVPQVRDVDYQLDPTRAGRLESVSIDLEQPAHKVDVRLRPAGRRFRCSPISNRTWHCDTPDFKLSRVTNVSVRSR